MLNTVKTGRHLQSLLQKILDAVLLLNQMVCMKTLLPISLRLRTICEHQDLQVSSPLAAEVLAVVDMLLHKRASNMACAVLRAQMLS